MTPPEKPRLLIFIVAYYAEATILQVLERIPPLEDYQVQVLLIDDGSTDRTFQLSERLSQSGSYRFPLTVLSNPVNQGYGGNQKLGYHFAIEQGFDLVALLHGDGQYAPEMLPRLLAPFARGEADVVLGSRLLVPRDALKGGMPIYKFVGNRLLTWYQNRVLRSRLSEFHTGYKVYTTAALRRIPFELNSNVFHFDTEIIIQLLRAQCRIAEVAIPTFYGDEICRVNGLKYAKDVVNASTVARLQDYGLVYRRNFDIPAVPSTVAPDSAKLEFVSTHSEALKEVPPGAVVLDAGCGPGPLCAALRAQGCRVIGLDRAPPADPSRFDEFIAADLDQGGWPRKLDDVNVVLLLDVVEHLRSPEQFCERLRLAAQDNLGVKLVLTTGNVGFCVTRLMLLLGQFNYNRRGILDLTHTRLFTFSSLRRLLQETGFVVDRIRGIPAPAPLVVRSARKQRWLMRAQAGLIRLCRGLFAYQILLVARPLPTVDTLLRRTQDNSRQKALAAHG